MKRSRLRPISKKRAALKRRTGPARKAFIADVAGCMACSNARDLCVHEMTNGPNRERALSVRAACLVLCGWCNSHVFTDKWKWPLPRQLALKLIMDPKHFDLDAINELLAPKGNKAPPQAVTLPDVVQFLDMKYLGVGR